MSAKKEIRFPQRRSNGPQQRSSPTPDKIPNGIDYSSVLAGDSAVPAALVTEMTAAVGKFVALGVTEAFQPFLRSVTAFGSPFRVIFVSGSIKKAVEASAPFAFTVIFLGPI